jgi:hypothetical protein
MERSILQNRSTDGDGGSARVSSLVWQVLSVVSDGKSRLIVLSRPVSESITVADKVRFAALPVGGQIARSFDWLFFNHVDPRPCKAICLRGSAAVRHLPAQC